MPLSTAITGVKRAAILGGLCVAGCLVSPDARSADNVSIAGRVASDFPSQSGRDVWHYAVPPMSEIQRLPDAYPTDGTPGGVVRIVVARDEYEPGSFLVWANKDLGKVRFELGDFKSGTGEMLPKDALDLKFVKVWYQNRNGWFSYFGDTGFKLCPELLLNDEDLIRVDTKKEANYARLIDEKGRKSEQWINPPRQMDVRPLAQAWRTGDTFACMRPDFRDAASLQPVALPKNEFRNFFLTVHAAKDAKSGLYKGAVAMTSVETGVKVGEIPVEIRILDFTLPAPKCYNEPEKDFLVSSYSYISFDHIAERNGGDGELARRQLVAVLKNQVAHNQTMHMVRGNFNNEAFETIAAMKEAGMRTDVFQGCVSPKVGPPEKMRAHAQIVADEFDRRFGHHNLHIGYGDEPGAKWLAQNRPVFESYQSAGLKFFIAGHTVFTKAGYFYDWHNAAHDATDDSIPALWGRMHGPGHAAWYANQHVGSENPAFNRRQNGLGAYLTGYTALCNYAHHFGPYNDDSTTYKPMVLAYGSGDGVIDTIAWEGFREGVDDIRYATLMTDFARKARKSKDLKTRYLGAKAMQFLALTNPKSCDQDAVRGEMIRFITALKPLVAPYDVKPETVANDAEAARAGAARAEAKVQAAVKEAAAKLATARNAAETNKVHAAVAGVYAAYGREADGGAYLEKRGLYEQAMRHYRHVPAKARELSEKIYAANKANFFSRLSDHPEIIEDFDVAVFGNLRANDTNGWTRAIKNLFKQLGGNHAYVHGVKPKAFVAVYRKLLPVADEWGVATPAAVAKNAVWAFLQLHDAAGVQEAAARGLTDETAKGEEKYGLGLAAALATTTGNPADFLAAAKAYDAGFKGLTQKARVEALCAYASARMQAGDENAVRGLDQFRKSLYRPEPRKRYVVGFSDTPIAGFSDWAKVAAETQTYDRRYGGNLDFLVTDVTSGERAAGNSTEKLADPTMAVVADVNGIHVLVRQVDPKAKDVALGLVANCSFEGYIAPGENTPYACFMYTPQSGKASIFNTTYPTFVDRPIEARTPDRKFRFQSDYADGEARHHFFFSWENWMQRIPEDGFVWDFENMCWHRSGNSCWNGTESIHGRSTWGEFEFRLTRAQRARILRPLLVKAYAAYNAEKRTTAESDGALVHWADEAIGDPEFHAAQIKPLVDELDALGGQIVSDMTDETVFRLAREALPRWLDVGFEVARRRARWLLERNAR